MGHCRCAGSRRRNSSRRPPAPGGVTRTTRKLWPVGVCDSLGGSAPGHRDQVLQRPIIDLPLRRNRYGRPVSGTAQPLGDGTVTLEKLRTLLAFGSELDDLDYKEYLDLSKSGQRDKVELVKDLAAMQSIPTGGYVVVGVDGAGNPSERLGKLVAAEFDPANLHRIASNYLPTIQVRAATHQVEGITVAIVYAGPPSPPTLPILVKDGQHFDGKTTKSVFSPGDVFVRRGTQSVRWTPADLPALLKPWEESIREDERRRATAYLEQVQVGERGRAIARGPLGALTWRLASEEYDAAVLEAIRGNDELALRKLFLTFGSDAPALIRSRQQEEFDLLLDRLIASLALTVTYKQKELFEQLLEVLVDVYRSSIDGSGNPLPSEDSTTHQNLLWRMVVGVEAVGGLAVRLRQFWAVRRLARPSTPLVNQIGEPSWIRHAVTAAARAGLLNTGPAEGGGQRREIGGPVVSLARQLVERIPALRPDTDVSRFELNTAPDAFDKVLDSLIQFDVLWCVMAVASSGHEYDQYPSFASFYAHRADPALELLINDSDVSELLLGGEAGNLKQAMEKVVNVARQVSLQHRFMPWAPQSQVVEEYLKA